MANVHTAPAAAGARGSAPEAPPLDPALTAPFELGVGPGACLLVHGFTGTPWDVRPPGEALAAGGFRVRGLRLPGHGTTPRAMLDAGAPDWLAACEEGLAAFREPRVAVVGLSMGALLALVLAARHRDRVQAVVGMAPALRFKDPLTRGLRFARPLSLALAARLRPWVHKTTTDLIDPEARAAAPVLSAWPLRRLRDLWEMQDLAWAAAPRVEAPVLLAVARHDRVVDIRGARALVRRLTRASSVRFIELDRGAHIMPRDEGRQVLAQEVLGFLRRGRTLDSGTATE
jgi:carboxylesterase